MPRPGTRDPQPLADRYETLRRAWLAGAPPTQGLRLLTSRGLAACLPIWQACIPVPAVPSPPAWGRVSQDDTRGKVPTAGFAPMSRELVHVVTAMVVGTLEGGRA